MAYSIKEEGRGIMIGSRGEYGRPKRLRLRPNGISRAVVYFGIHRDDDEGRTDGKSIDRSCFVLLM